MKGKFWRKALAAALALLIVSGSTPIQPLSQVLEKSVMTVSAADLSGSCGENAQWSYDTETFTLTITGTGATYGYDGTNNPWYDYRGQVKNLVVSEGITSLGECSFANFGALENVSLPSGLDSIGNAAFATCGSLRSINIPDGVTSIEEDTFVSCSSLEYLNIPNSVTSIGKFAFAGCSSLEYLNIPNSVTSIGEFAFQNCLSLKYVLIPDSVTNIGISAFSGCPKLKDICLLVSDPSYLSWDNLNNDLKGNVTIHVGNGFEDKFRDRFGSDKFSDDLDDYRCGENAYCFFDSDTGKLTIIGTGAMNNYYGYDPTWQEYIDSITSVEIASGITTIGDGAFSDCENLTEVTIPDSVTSIGHDAFSGCLNLTEVTIPGSVTYIGNDAFFCCTGVTDVYCYADPEKLTWDEDGYDDFIYSYNEKDVHGTTVCHVPAEYYDTYVSKFSGVVNVTFMKIISGQCGENATWLLDMNTGVLTISGTGAMNNYYVDYSTWQEYIDSITSVEIASGITTIGDYAFSDCVSLTEVTIPDSVTSIGYDAFIGCSSLESIEIPGSVTYIRDNAFYACESLTSIEIPNSVTSIGNNAFRDCKKLQSVTIPSSVTRIGYDAFYYCTGVTDVYCYADPEKLTWDEDGCDDFIRNPKHTTVCHVPAEYLADYQTKFGGKVNVTFVGDLVDMGLGEHLYGHSISLEGDIGVNFYVELTDELLASETAEMVFTVPNGSKTDTQTLSVKDVIADDTNKVSIGGKTYYKFKCSISAKDMASTITAKLIDGEKSGKEYTYSVKDYADYLLAHTENNAEYAKAAPLVKAMLNYGAASQSYFGIEGTAANASLNDEDKALGEVSIPDTFKFNEANAVLPEGVTFEGATLSLKSETTLSLYFKELPEDTVFTCEGKTVETAKNGDHVVARIRGIKANELENDFTVTFEGDSVTYNVTYNVMTYCYNVLNDGTVDDNLQNVCKALYNYAQAAINYAG